MAFRGWPPRGFRKLLGDPHLAQEIGGFRIARLDRLRQGGAALRVAAVQVRACFEQLSGQNVRGAQNIVSLRVASLADFLVMKAHAIGGRDKPKDTYDLCYCLGQIPEGIEKLAADWKPRLQERGVARAIETLREKFADPDAFGPQQLVEFHAAPDLETQAIHARTAYELVQKFLRRL